MQDFKKEDRVRYVPHHANGDQSHPDCETGIVYCVNVGGTVFVKFDKQIQRIGWADAQAQGCDPDSLVLIED